jgi:hypothetical protein
LAKDPGERENALQEIAARLWQRLPNFLRFQDERPGAHFISWAMIVGQRAASDYRRTHSLCKRRRGRQASGNPISFVSLTGDNGQDTRYAPEWQPVGTSQWAMLYSIDNWARENLTHEQYSALAGWLCEKTPRQTPSVRAALARIRRRFAPAE